MTATEWDELTRSGLASSSGNALQWIHPATAYYNAAQREPGALLTEHRRCVPPIIQYCNVLTYQNQLKALRDAIPENQQILPPMSLLSINGAAQTQNGSWQNPDEAQAILQWLHDWAKPLSTHYHAPIDKLVGIVTPYAAQTLLIQKQMKANGWPSFTIGTTHALQGAERRIILFSSVMDSSQDARSYFINRHPYLLNVAVSRAQDSFLVFAHPIVFENSPATSPVGILKEFLQPFAAVPPSPTISFKPTN